MSMPYLLKTALLFSVLFLSGCYSQFKEVHYFKDKLKPFPNYYKLRISGFTFLASSRYLSGYFDENAVNEYFNEFTQKDNGRLFEKDEKQDKSLEPLSPSLKDKRLVMMLSSNSDAIATQIGSLVETQQTMDALGQLLNREGATSLLEIESDQKMYEANWRSVQALGDQMIGTLNPATVTPAQAEAMLLEFVNTLARELGNKTPFTNLNDAATWLQNNR